MTTHDEVGPVVFVTVKFVVKADPAVEFEILAEEFVVVVDALDALVATVTDVLELVLVIIGVWVVDLNECKLFAT